MTLLRDPESLGLTTEDLRELAAEECGLITDADRQHAEDWWDEQYERAAIEYDKRAERREDI